MRRVSELWQADGSLKVFAKPCWMKGKGMDASPRRIIELITGAGTRLVIPVFQRPYSWEEENCAQLWDDILTVGKGNGAPHFTGSVVWIQQGTMSASGVTPLMLIDGQQRITTITLLIIALARYAKAHPNRTMAFSFREIIGRGYLVDEYKSGDDRYKLTLSQGDRETLRSLMDNLQNPDTPIVESSSRILDNLAFFEGRVSTYEDPNVIWAGIQRLEVVSISLTQGQDNPQLIFESMNSTGKGLSSADLIRNFVLMGQPDQDQLYETYWRPIEEALGASTYDAVFDEFVRDWLTVLHAPEPLVRRDVYQSFKRHFEEEGYGDGKPVTELLKELKRFASYYADITSGRSVDPEVGKWLGLIRRLGISVVDPLLMSMLDDFEHHAFDRDNLLTMLATIESYLFRRTVCDCATNSLQKFFSSVMGRLNRVQDEGGNYAEAFSAFLLNEAGTARRFPTDAEFADHLRTRDTYHFRRCLYLLSRLENSYHTKNERDFANGTYTIEHIMPQNARAHDDWLRMLGNVDDERFTHLVHNLGNLTLTAYNSELSDGTFRQKRERAVGGYNVEWVTISSDLKDADEWTPEAIAKRAQRLVRRSLSVWPMPQVDEDVRKSYQPQKRTAEPGRPITFKDLINAGLVHAGDTLVSASTKYPGTATVTSSGMILLENGEEFKSPSVAHIRLIQLNGSARTTSNGWHAWRLGSQDGPLLDDLRKSGVVVHEETKDFDDRQFKRNFWAEFNEWCGEQGSFVEAFGDPSSLPDVERAWSDYKGGLSKCHITVRVDRKNGQVGAGPWLYSRKYYKDLYALRAEIEADLAGDGVTFKWSWPNGKSKHPEAIVYKVVNLDDGDYTEVFSWMAHAMLRMRAYAMRAGL